ncbi:hypothetical protein ADK86_26165 [Streptomyces sp. NRRL F-5755]|nr:hypothetical protein ADK86_26165 [Streptomyces sp. NRRL F-5755]
MPTGEIHQDGPAVEQHVTKVASLQVFDAIERDDEQAIAFFNIIRIDSQRRIVRPGLPFEEFFCCL